MGWGTISGGAVGGARARTGRGWRRDGCGVKIVLHLGWEEQRVWN